MTEPPRFGLAKAADKHLVALVGPATVRFVTSSGVALLAVDETGIASAQPKDSWIMNLVKPMASVTLMPPPRTPEERLTDCLSDLDRTAALEKLADLGRGDAFRADDKLSQRGDPDVAATGCAVVSATVLAILESGNESERKAAAKAAGEWCGEIALPRLSKAIAESTDRKLRGLCAWAIGQIGGHAAMAELMKFAADKTEQTDLRHEALEALVNLVSGGWEIFMQSGNPPPFNESWATPLRDFLVALGARPDDPLAETARFAAPYFAPRGPDYVLPYLRAQAEQQARKDQ